MAKHSNNSEILNMIGIIEQYAETAGFENYYERVLKNMTDDEIIKHYEKLSDELGDYIENFK